jgi:Uma2 family endonuclease
MTQTTKLPQLRPATEADWAAVPAPYTAHLIDGELHAMGRPRARHAVAMSGLISTLTGPFQRGLGGPGGWLLLPEVDVRVRRDIVAPDLAGWRRERMPDVPDETPILLAPDWVCEVLSPGTETFDRGVKATWYASVGVGWLWFVDPEAKTLEIYRNDAGAWRPAGTWQGVAEVTTPPFDALPWSLTSLWG